MKLAPAPLLVLTGLALTGLVLPVGPATAGPCSMEIDHLQKTLAYNNMGAGRVGAPTGLISNSVGDENRIVNSVGIENRIGPIPPETAGTTQVNTGNTGQSPTGGTNPQLIPAPGSQAGIPTYTDAANTPSAPANSPASNAADALSLAREYDRAGRELDCQGQVDRASSILNNL